MYLILGSFFPPFFVVCFVSIPFPRTLFLSFYQPFFYSLSSLLCIWFRISSVLSVLSLLSWSLLSSVPLCYCLFLSSPFALILDSLYSVFVSFILFLSSPFVLPFLIFLYSSSFFIFFLVFVNFITSFLFYSVLSSIPLHYRFPFPI